LARDRGFDEINLNCGCPSPAARGGSFGARLMLDPGRVAECVAAMSAAGIPVSVKHRIGVDDHDAPERLLQFVDRVAEAGCTRFIVHARKAWLHGLDPESNRTVPPLRHDTVVWLARERPALAFELNGGITTLADASAILTGEPHLAGVMVGRAIADQPWTFAGIDMAFGDRGEVPKLPDVLEHMLAYAERECARGSRLLDIARPLLGLFARVPGGRAVRRRLSTADLRSSSTAPLHEALAAWQPVSPC
jgi:tRNA-dihydrouridine synthase A